MNREWRHQFGPEITIEKGCWNVIAILPCEETIRNMFFWFNVAFNYRNVWKVSNYFHLCMVPERLSKYYIRLILLFPKVMFYICIQLNKKREIEFLKAINPSK